MTRLGGVTDPAADAAIDAAATNLNQAVARFHATGESLKYGSTRRPV